MSDSMTLAFELEALEPLADPAAVFEDARRWSTHVGVVSDKMAYQVINYLRDQGVYNEDFFSRADRACSLAHIRETTDTERYVFVGRSEDDADLARECGWEFQPVEKAARKADWDLGTPVEQ